MPDIDWSKTEQQFTKYIEECVYSDGMLNRIIEEFSKYYEVFIFGGVIRDFVLKGSNWTAHRDIDLVTTGMNKQMKEILLGIKSTVNSFGGFKFQTERNIVDVWELKSTWALRKFLQFEFMAFDAWELPLTAFFNVTAAIYSLNTKTMYLSKDFKDGMEKRKLEITFEPNPSPSLCIIKTIEYYYEKGLLPGKELIRYVLEREDVIPLDVLIETQKKHYGDVRYSIDEMHGYYEMLRSRREYKTKRNLILEKRRLEEAGQKNLFSRE